MRQNKPSPGKPEGDCLTHVRQSTPLMLLVISRTTRKIRTITIGRLCNLRKRCSKRKVTESTTSTDSELEEEN
jgi:hypothetical protein